MGAWAWPFSSRKTALKFRRRMSEPWVATVKKNSGDSLYSWRARDLSFGAGLYGEDGLWDDLAREANRRKKAFDVRPVIVRNLKRDMRFLRNVIGLNFRLEDYNIVCKTIGIAPLHEKDISEGVRAISNIIEQVRDGGGMVTRAHQIDLQDKALVRLLKVPAKIARTYSSKKHICLSAVISGKRMVATNLCGGPLVEESTIRKKGPMEFLCIILLARRKHVGTNSVDLVYKNGNSHKYWRARVEKNRLIAQYGKVGAKPRETIKAFSRGEIATENLNRLTAQKIKKGYYHK
jgi:predicted DNA-binding WGR domain protein